MKNVTTLAELKGKAIAIKHPVKVCWPQHGGKEELLVPKLDMSLEKGYESNNGTIAFVSDQMLYVIPYMRKVMQILDESGFTRKSMYVPFSNWDYPVAEKFAWEALKRTAEEQHQLDFIADCNKFADEHGFKTIEETLFEKCFEMPAKGVEVEHLNFRDTYYPAITGTFLDCVASDRIGRYCTNNGTCVFIYRDGKTYVTRSREVMDALYDAGYVEGGLFVPFSNGERIKDAVYAQQWQRVIA